MLLKEETYLYQYWQMIESGQIIAGYWLKKEIKNLIDDLDNPDYIYDTREANNRIKFAQTCCLQGKDPYYNKPFVLAPFQKAFIEALYSFKMADTGLRRFTEALLLIARKNGKSSIMAADAMYDLMLGKGGQDICCASNDDKQARLIWEEIKGMAKRLDTKGSMTSCNLTEIRNDVKDIKITRMSGKSQNKDGRNYSKVYFDEGHECAEENGQSELAEACWRSMSTKDEPLFITCSTQGFNRDCYLDKKIEIAKNVIDGVIDNPHLLAFLYLQDSEIEIWQDEASWEKSNPAIRYGIKKTSKLEQDIETAKQDVGARIHLLCKDFNITTSSAKGWLNIEDYDYEQKPWTLEDFKGCICIAAADLSMTTDLTNVKLMFLRPDNKTKYIYSHYWIPEAKLVKADDASVGANYKEWVKQGFVSVCEGADNNLTDVAYWILDLKQKYNIRALRVFYDQRFAKEFINVLDDAGVETEVIQQNKYTLSTPTKFLESELKSHNINYNNNPVDKWCYGNSALEVDNMGRQQIVKMRGTHDRRIDGAVACAILFAGYQRCKEELNKYIR